MNFSDIAHLKPLNIDKTFLQFIRTKTKRTKKKDQRPIKVGLHPRAVAIIKKWKNKDVINPYLFPILDTGLTPIQIKYKIQGFIKIVNEEMSKIAAELKFNFKLGTYVARHSFSTRLKRKGVSTEFIKESLGHSSVATTENYLDSFADDVKLEYSKLLID